MVRDMKDGSGAALVAVKDIASGSLHTAGACRVSVFCVCIQDVHRFLDEVCMRRIGFSVFLSCMRTLFFTCLQSHYLLILSPNLARSPNLHSWSQVPESFLVQYHR